jgi:far upstream element-binding protein
MVAASAMTMNNDLLVSLQKHQVRCQEDIIMLRECVKRLELMVKHAREKARAESTAIEQRELRYEPIEKLREEIAEHERALSTSSMSLVMEKETLKMIDAAKSKLSLLGAHEKHRNDITELVQKKAKVSAAITLKEKAVNELRVAMKKVELAQRCDVPVTSLEDAEMMIKKSSIGMIVGRGGANIRRLQDLFAVVLDLQDVPGMSEMSRLKIKGSKEGVAQAKQEVTNIENTITDEIDLSDEEIELLIRNGPIMGQMEETHGVKVDCQRKEKILQVRGPKPNCDAALQAAKNLLKSGVEVVVSPAKLMGSVIGKGGATIRSLQEQTGAIIQGERKGSRKDGDDKDSAIVRIYSMLPEQLTAAVAAVSDLIEASREHTEEVMLDEIAKGEEGLDELNRVLRTNGNAMLRQFGEESGGAFVKLTGADLSAGDSAGGSKARNRDRVLRVSGNREQVDRALVLVQQFLHDNQIVEVIVDEALVGGIVGKGGSAIRAMEAETGASLQLPRRSKKSGRVLIRGTPEAVARAQAAMTGALEELTPLSFEMNVQPRLGGIIIGKKGVTVREIVANSGANVTVGKDGRIVFKGRKGQVEQAKLAVTGLVQENERVVEEVEVHSDMTGLLIGKGGEKIRAIERKTGATVNVGRSKGKSSDEAVKVRIRGTRKEVAAATDEIGFLTAGLDAEDMVVPSEQVRALIGKKGENIRQIQRESGAQLDVDRDTQGLVHIRGPVEAVAKAKDLIADFLKTNHLEKVSVPMEVAPFIIGKGGANVRHIEASSGAKVQVQGEGMVLIRGDFEKVQKAKAAVEALLERNVLVEVEDGLVGAIIGKKGATISGLEDTHEVMIEVLDDGSGGDGGGDAEGEGGSSRVLLKGDPTKVAECKAAILELLGEMARETSTLPIDIGCIPALLARGSALIKQLQSETSTQIEVIRCAASLDDDDDDDDDGDGDSGSFVKVTGKPDAVALATEKIRPLLVEMVESIDISGQGNLGGLIIGKGGKTIMRIQEESGGAEVQVSRDGKVVIRGHASAVAKAKEAVQALMDANEEFEEIIDIDEGTAGAVIGKGGSTIRMIEEVSGAKINVEDERVTVTGSAEAVEAAVRAVHAVLDQAEENSDGPPDMTIDPDSTGMVVGKGGSMIKQIEQESGAKVQIDRDGSIRLSGDDEQVEAAREQIEKLLASAPVIVEVEEGRMGGVIGKGGETIKKLQEEHGVTINSLQGRSAFRVSGDDPEDVVAAVEAIERIANTDNRRGGGGGGERGSYEGEPDLTIDPDQTGLVVGKGGNTIRQIEEDSGASVQIGRDGSIRLRGDDEQVEAAREAIEKILDSDNRGDRGGGDRANYGGRNREPDMMVGPDQTGMIVGKGGATIRQIEEASGARVQIDRDGSIRLSGSEAQVEDAKAAITAIMGSAPVIVEVDEERMGAVIGKGGETIRELQEEHGVNINSVRDRAAFRVSGDDPEGVASAVEAIERIAGARERAIGQRGDVLQANLVHQEICTEVIDVGVHSGCIRVLLDREGAIVAQISAETGAQISPSRVAGTVEIQGSAGSVAAAKLRVEELTKGEGIVPISVNHMAILVQKGQMNLQLVSNNSGAKVELEEFEVDDDADGGGGGQVRITGDPRAVQVAKSGVGQLLRFFFPSEFAEVNVDRGVLSELLRLQEAPHHDEYHDDDDYDSGHTQQTLLATLQAECTACLLTVDFGRGVIKIAANAAPDTGTAEGEEPASAAASVTSAVAAVHQRLDALKRELAVVEADAELLRRPRVREGMQLIERESGASIRLMRGGGNSGQQLLQIRGIGGGEAAAEAVKTATEAVKQLLYDTQALSKDLQVDKSCVPAIIGRGGSTIRQLELDTGASFDVARDGTVTVSGESAEALEAGCAAVAAVVEKWQAENHSFEIYLGDSAGLIIGRGGETIRQLQEDSGARIDIDRDSGNAVIRGSLEAMAKGKEMVEDLLGQASERDGGWGGGGDGGGGGGKGGGGEGGGKGGGKGGGGGGKGGGGGGGWGGAAKPEEEEERGAKHKYDAVPFGNPYGGGSTASKSARRRERRRDGGSAQQQQQPHQSYGAGGYGGYGGGGQATQHAGMANVGSMQLHSQVQVPATTATYTQFKTPSAGGASNAQEHTLLNTIDDLLGDADVVDMGGTNDDQQGGGDLGLDFDGEDSSWLDSVLGAYN